MKQKVFKVVALVVTVGMCCVGSNEFKCEALNVQNSKAQVVQLVTDSTTSTDATQNEDNSVVANDSTFTWQEISVTVPESWKGKYEVVEYKNGFKFVQKASMEKDKDLGYICGFYRTDNNVLQFSGEKMLAYTGDTMYYSSQPTDVSCYYKDKKIMQEYSDMLKEVDDVEASLKIDKENVKYDATEYVLPMSATVKVNKEYLESLNDNELLVARNEIYARHGKQFKNTYLKQYFAKCSWYTESKSYNASCLSKIEKSNITAIEKAEKAYKKQNPYPKKLKFGKTYSENLTGAKSGKKQKFKVTVKKQTNSDDYKIKVTIDGKSFDLADYKVYFASMEDKCYYVTDISSFEPGLEIAFMDYGPSDDLITYFFTYSKGKLRYIGSVGGFPFKEYTGYNFFNNGGLVQSMFRADLINTCYAYKTCRYNIQKKKIEAIKYDMYPMMGEQHKLLVDLPVYVTKSVKAKQVIMKAQKKVFFVETDGKAWIKVRAKDGTEGYIHIKKQKITNNGKKATDVFSDLFFCD